MATPKKRKPHTFLYTDGSYITYDLTKEDFELIEKALCDDEEWKYVPISIGIVGMEGIRSIIEQKEIEQDQEEEVKQDTYPVLDQESMEWLKEYMGGS